MKNLLNKRVGKLVVIEHLGKLGVGKNLRHRWKCKCDCGGTVITQSNHLLSGDTRSCGCLNLRTGKNSPGFRGYGEIPLSFYNRMKRYCRPKERNLEFKVPIKYIWDLFLTQNRKCALSGELLRWDGSDMENKHTETSKRTASLDRIDSTKGYVKGNVQWVHKDLNYMKQDINEQKFVEWCRKVTAYKLSA